MAESVSLYPLGVGNSFTQRHWFSNVLLIVDGREIFIDAPAYMSKMLGENNKKGELKGLTMERYRELIITHMHADHIGGVEELAYIHYFKSTDVPKLYAPKWLLQDMWTHLRPAMEDSARGDGGLAAFDWYFKPIPMDNPHDFGGFSVSHHLTKHIPRTVAYLFDFGNFKFAFSADTGFDRELIEWLDQADVVLHDVRVGPMHARGGNLHCFHASIADLLTLPESFQRKTYLYHYPDDMYDEDPRKPNYELGHYRLLEQNKLYKLL